LEGICSMPASSRRTVSIVLLLLSASLLPAYAQLKGKDFEQAAAEQAKMYLEQGLQIFRFDTFDSENFWGGKLKLHEAIMGEKLRAVGPGLSPEKALELGLKVDINAIPRRSPKLLTRARSI
jgi:hypothetical protein